MAFDVTPVVQIVGLLGIGSILGGLFGAFYGPLISDYLAQRTLRKTLYRELVHLYGRAQSFHQLLSEENPYIRPNQIAFFLQALMTQNFYSYVQSDPEHLKHFYLLPDAVTIDKLYRNFQMPFRPEIEKYAEQTKGTIDNYRCELLGAAIDAFEKEVRESKTGREGLDKKKLSKACSEQLRCKLFQISPETTQPSLSKGER